jgi:hypothetical protein
MWRPTALTTQSARTVATWNALARAVADNLETSRVGAPLGPARGANRCYALAGELDVDDALRIVDHNLATGEGTLETR